MSRLVDLRRVLTAGLAAVALPVGWPHHMVLGAADGPGGARDLTAHARLDARYQYLAGGVNTGGGWATWNPHGTFAANYVRESRAFGLVPVLTYYQLLQSKPDRGGDEATRDLAHLRDGVTMRAYWRDFSLLLRRVHEADGGRLVVVHVEPDLWGYLEQRGAATLAGRFARRLAALRARLAPEVALAWHLSVWGTREDPTYSKPTLAHMDQLAVRSARFYRSLHARFDLAFNDVTDRDSGYYRVVRGNANTAWGPEDFRRHDAYTAGFARRTGTPVVLWQLPLGNTMLDDTWGHFRDNRVQWWLDDASGEHLRQTRDAGVIGLLFGGGADGTTAPQTDGGLFWRLAARYESAPAALGGAVAAGRGDSG